MNQLRLAPLLSLALLPLSASAQTQPGFDASARRAIIESVAERIETLYVLPEKGKSLATQIRASVAAGKYESASSPSALADALNAELSSANDRHLSVRAGAVPSSVSSPVMRSPATGPAASAPPAGGPRKRRVRPGSGDERLMNYGLRRVEHLEGNIGYLDLGGFMSDSAEGRAVVTGAMQFLANSDVIIVDVRRCPGGSPDSVSYIASHFFGPERRVLMNRYDRPSDTTSQSKTVEVAGPRFPEKELYILAGKNSASACESFAYTMQQWDRAKIVGEKTAGAGYNNVIIPLDHGLRLSVSVGTAIHPKSGKGWEAVGVQPDIPTPVDGALEVARSEALKNLRAKRGE